MKKKTIRDIDVVGKRVIHHCDFNIKLIENEKGELVPISDVRLKAFFPSIFFLLEKNCKIIFISYLERPGGKVVEHLRTTPIAKRLSQLINKQVHALNDCIGPRVKRFIAKMEPGEMVMLENTRFYPGEESDDDDFAKKLASNGDLMVEDAFGHCHRVHASTTGISRHLPSVAGFYLEKEIEIFDRLIKNPQRPLVLIVGGTKVFEKIKAIKNLIGKADFILIGGAVGSNFLKAKGVKIDSSFLGESFVGKDKGEKKDCVGLAYELLRRFSSKIILPEDLVFVDNIDHPQKEKIVNLAEGEKFPSGWGNLDIGPKTIEKFLKIIKEAKTIFWSGPLGRYEDERFLKGSLKVAQAMSEDKKTTILAGGDTASVAEKYDLIFKYSHVSIAGGAALEYLAGKKLPGIEALLDK